MRSRPSSSLSNRRGYTAVEVLMAMTVMTIGAAAVMSMQKASVQGNLDARETDVANSIARMWVERLQRDAMQWTQPNNANPLLNNFVQAKLLYGGIITNKGQWGVPNFEMGVTTPETMSYAFDILGRDIPSAQIGSGKTTDPETIFCVNYRLQYLVPPTLPMEPGLIRADVRVLWPRGIYNTPNPSAPQAWCSDNSGIMTAADPEGASGVIAGSGPAFHSLYLTTTIKQGSQQ
jgi:prepilin-type N-terminal cleavage/methylation domain-containing protein